MNFDDNNPDFSSTTSKKRVEQEATPTRTGGL